MAETWRVATNANDLPNGGRCKIKVPDDKVLSKKIPMASVGATWLRARSTDMDAAFEPGTVVISKAPAADQLKMIEGVKGPKRKKVKAARFVRLDRSQHEIPLPTNLGPLFDASAILVPA